MLDRLTTADLMMLRPEEFGWREDIGALLFVDGSAFAGDDGAFDLDSARSLVAARLHLAPQLRKVVRIQPWGLGAPLWLDAPSFDVGAHVGHVPLPAGASEAQLLDEVELLRRRPFDWSRPLWEMWFLTGLADGRVALYAKLHHTIADGVAGLMVLAAFLDPEPITDAPPRAPEWVPAAAPTTRRVLADNARRWSSDLLGALAGVSHPVRLGRRLRTSWRSMWSILAMSRVPLTSLNRPVGAARRLVLIRCQLADVRAAAHTHGATVNDVLMTAVAGGYRELLLHRGEPVAGVVLRASVPVSLHAAHGGARANDDGMMFVPLPVGIADPVERLVSISRETAVLKRHVDPQPDGFVMRTRTVQRAFWRGFDHQRWSNAYAANVPGPPEPMYLGGARVEAMFPIVPIMGNLTIGVGALSYDGQFNVTVVADAGSCPDLDVFVGGIRAVLDRRTAAQAS